MDLVPPKIKPNGKSIRHVYAFDGARTQNKIAFFLFWDKRDKQKSLQIWTCKIWKASSIWIKSQNSLRWSSRENLEDDLKIPGNKILLHYSIY
jgi:hypothetical protein